MIPYAELNEIRNVAIDRSNERWRNDHINPLIRAENVPDGMLYDPLTHDGSKDTIILMSFDQAIGRYIYADVARVDRWLKLHADEKRNLVRRAADHIVNQHLENASRVP